MNQAERLHDCIAGGGVAVFPSDTVYGLACDPEDPAAVERLYRLKNRAAGKPSAVMFFALDVALSALPELGTRLRAAMSRLLPGGVTLLLPNPEDRFRLAAAEEGGGLGLRVPDLPLLASVRMPVLQSSANLAGGAEPQRLEDVPESIRSQVDLVIDGGTLPGTASTVVDLRRYEEDGSWSIVRLGAVSQDDVAAAL